MTIVDLLQSAQFVVDTDGKQQAVQIDIDQWKELLVFLKMVETWEQEWYQPFEAIREAWQTSSPAPAEDQIPNDKELVHLVHEIRNEIN